MLKRYILSGSMAVFSLICMGVFILTAELQNGDSQSILLLYQLSLFLTVLALLPTRCFGKQKKLLFRKRQLDEGEMDILSSTDNLSLTLYFSAFFILSMIYFIARISLPNHWRMAFQSSHGRFPIWLYNISIIVDVFASFNILVLINASIGIIKQVSVSREESGLVA